MGGGKQENGWLNVNECVELVKPKKGRLGRKKGTEKMGVASLAKELNFN